MGAGGAAGVEPAGGEATVEPAEVSVPVVPAPVSAGGVPPLWLEDESAAVSSSPACGTNGSLTSKSVNEASWLVSTLTTWPRGRETPAIEAEPLVGTVATATGTGVPATGVPATDVPATGATVDAGAAVDPPPFIIFGTWNAATARRSTPPTIRIIFCFFALAAAVSYAVLLAIRGSLLPRQSLRRTCR